MRLIPVLAVPFVLLLSALPGPALAAPQAGVYFDASATVSQQGNLLAFQQFPLYVVIREADLSGFEFRIEASEGLTVLGEQVLEGPHIGHIPGEYHWLLSNCYDGAVVVIELTVMVGAPGATDLTLCLVPNGNETARYRVCEGDFEPLELAPHASTASLDGCAVVNPSATVAAGETSFGAIKTRF